MSSRAERKERRRAAERIICEKLKERTQQQINDFLKNGDSKNSLEYLSFLEAMQLTLPNIVVEEIVDELKAIAKIEYKNAFETEMDCLRQKFSPTESSDNEALNLSGIKTSIEYFQKTAFRWGVSLKLHRTILFLSKNPDAPYSIPDRKSYEEKLISDVSLSKLSPSQKHFFFVCLEGMLKLLCESDQYTKIEKIIAIFRKEVVTKKEMVGGKVAI